MTSTGSPDAETYLRLLAERELRAALSQPKAVRRRRAPGWLRPRFLRAIWRSYQNTAVRSSHISLAVRRRRRGRPPESRQLPAAATALTGSGALDSEVADTIIEYQELALWLRQRLSGPPPWLRNRRQAISHPVAPLRIVAVGGRMTVAGPGRSYDVSLLALAIVSDRSVLTVSAVPASGNEPDDGHGDHDPPFLHTITATDDHGGSYQGGFSGGGSRDGWTGRFQLRPALRPGIRWLDVKLPPDGPTHRIALDQASPQYEVTVEPLPRSEQADRYLRSVGDTLLRAPEDGLSRPGFGSLPVIIDTLTGAGVIGPDEEVLRDLAALGRRLGVTLPPDLARLGDVELPGTWRNVLDNFDAADGPDGLTKAAALLPPQDGGTWALAGLTSTARFAELRVLGWNLAIERPGLRLRQFGLHQVPGGVSWQARDNAGRWHVTDCTNWSWADGAISLTLRLTPPLHPAATAVDIIATGPSERVTVTVPLSWEPA